MKTEQTMISLKYCFWEKEECIWGEHDQGVINTSDCPYVTSQTLPPPFQKNAKSETNKQKNPPKLFTYPRIQSWAVSLHQVICSSAHSVKIMLVGVTSSVKSSWKTLLHIISDGKIWCKRLRKKTIPINHNKKREKMGFEGAVVLSSLGGRRHVGLFYTWSVGLKLRDYLC